MDKNPVESYQKRVGVWMHDTFGEKLSKSMVERRRRLLEEALELVQSVGGTKEEAMDLVHYVFNRDIGEPPQETGGLLVTIACLCESAGIDMDKEAEIELARIWRNQDKIRAKQATKPPAIAVHDDEADVSTAVETWAAGSEHIPRQVIAVVTKGLTGVSEQLNEAIKVMVERYPTIIEGLPNSFSLNNKTIENERPEPTLTWNERYGRVIHGGLRAWMEGQTVTMASNGQGWEGISVVFFEPDVLGRHVVAAWACDGMTFSEVKYPSSKRDLDTTFDNPRVAVQFSVRNFDSGVAAISVAQALLDQINVVSANPYEGKEFK